MSYEKISGVRMNQTKNILEFKSHSNNDDCEPSYWQVQGNDFADKLTKTFNWWNEGSWQTSAITGGLLKLVYAFYKFREKLHNDIGGYPDYDNYEDYQAYKNDSKVYYEKYEKYIDSHKNDLLSFFNEDDTQMIYAAMYDNCPVINITKGGIKYRYYGCVDDAKRFTRKQSEVLKMKWSSKPLSFIRIEIL